MADYLQAYAPASASASALNATFQQDFGAAPESHAGPGLLELSVASCLAIIAALWIQKVSSAGKPEVLCASVSFAASNPLRALLDRSKRRPSLPTTRSLDRGTHRGRACI